MQRLSAYRFVSPPATSPSNERVAREAQTAYTQTRRSPIAIAPMDSIALTSTSPTPRPPRRFARPCCGLGGFLAPLLTIVIFLDLADAEVLHLRPVESADEQLYHLANRRRKNRNPDPVRRSTRKTRTFSPSMVRNTIGWRSANSFPARCTRPLCADRTMCRVRGATFIAAGSN